MIISLLVSLSLCLSVCLSVCLAYVVPAYISHDIMSSIDVSECGQSTFVPTEANDTDTNDVSHNDDPPRQQQRGSITPPNNKDDVDSDNDNPYDEIPAETKLHEASKTKKKEKEDKGKEGEEEGEIVYDEIPTHTNKGMGVVMLHANML